MQLRHGVGELFLSGPPAEELLEGPVLVAGIGVAVAAEEPGYPAPDILPVYLVPVGAASLAQEVSGGEPLDCFGVHPHRLGRLALGREIEPERADCPLERSRSTRLQRPGARCPHVHSLSLFLRRPGLRRSLDQCFRR